MTAKTTAERQAALRQARREAGLKEVRNLWCHPDDEAALREFASKLQRKRDRLGKIPHTRPKMDKKKAAT
jgi:hypothetical protein